MFVFWWTNRGFLTPLILFGTGVAAATVTSVIPFPHDSSWFAALVFLIAAPINWIVGRRQNYLRRTSFGRQPVWKQLVYGARHKFMSLPMESWSIAELALGIAFATRAALGG